MLGHDTNIESPPPYEAPNAPGHDTNTSDVKVKGPNDGSVHIFVDNSNIWAGACAWAKTKWGNEARCRINIDPPADKTHESLPFLLARGGPNRPNRIVQTRIVTGSKPPSNAKIWSDWKNVSYAVKLGIRETYFDDKGQEKKKESNVDASIHSQIVNVLFRAKMANETGTLVLVTGDGNNLEGGQASFPLIMMAAATDGWKVELWSWKALWSRKFDEVKERFPALVTQFFFDDMNPKNFVLRTDLPREKSPGPAGRDKSPGPAGRDKSPGPAGRNKSPGPAVAKEDKEKMVKEEHDQGGEAKHVHNGGQGEDSQGGQGDDVQEVQGEQIFFWPSRPRRRKPRRSLSRRR